MAKSYRQVLLVTSNERALGFAKFLQIWLGSVLTETRFVTVDQAEPPDDLGAFSFAIIVAAPRSRGGKYFWIEYGRLVQAFGHERVCLFEMGPSSLRLQVARFYPGKRSVLEMCRNIRDVTQIRFEDPALERVFQARWEQLALEIRAEFLDELWPTLDHDDIPLFVSKKSEDAGRRLQSAITHQHDIETMMEIASLWSMEIAPPDTGCARYFQLTIYLGSAESEHALENALGELLWELDLDVVVGLPAVYGSFFRRLWLKTKAALGSDEARKLLETFEYGVKQATLERQQADNTLKLAEAYSKIACTLDGEDEALIQLGSIIVAKQNGKLRVVSLTADQMMKFTDQSTLSGFADAAFRTIEGSNPQVLEEGIPRAIQMKSTTRALPAAPSDPSDDDL